MILLFTLSMVTISLVSILEVCSEVSIRISSSIRGNTGTRPPNVNVDCSFPRRRTRIFSSLFSFLKTQKYATVVKVMEKLTHR